MLSCRFVYHALRIIIPIRIVGHPTRPNSAVEISRGHGRADPTATAATAATGTSSALRSRRRRRRHRRRSGSPRGAQERESGRERAQELVRVRAIEGDSQSIEAVVRHTER